MKKLVLCFAIVMMCGCTPNGLEKPQPTLRFQIGDVVDLKIGGKGQVINIQGQGKPYLIRIRTDEGTNGAWFDEFELEIQ